MNDTPKGMRRHIAVLGRRNAGKSTLLNALARQTVSIVSDKAGTTTDPVEKTMELAPLGPVVLVDTAGVDDTGDLGALRVARTLDILGRTDLAILVTDGEIWDETERTLADKLRMANVPFLIARNKADTGLCDAGKWCANHSITDGTPVIDIAARDGSGVAETIRHLSLLGGADDDARAILSDLLPQNGLAVLVVPLDTGAPKGRLILPQVQAIRDCLDGQRICVVTTEKQLGETLAKLKSPPDLVVCDSQVVHIAAQITPADVPLTTFSILMARFKGNLREFAKGAAALDRLKPDDAVLIQEACSHHAQKDDIGRVKIPALLRKKAGGELAIRHAQGKELTPYQNDIKVIVHCGGCVITRKQMEARQANAGTIPMTNYGMAISLAQGILPRALEVFPDALAAYREAGGR